MNKWKREEAKVPVYDWTGDLWGETLEQLYNLSRLPFAFHHIAIMPDGHSGYGMPIGGVLATKNIIVPNAVGVDIGCGMIAMKLDITKENIDSTILKKIIHEAYNNIPVGFKKRDKSIDWANKCSGEILSSIFNNDLLCKEYKNSTHQLGTLGGGNHFIEIQVDASNHVWLMIHSGSRNLGKKVCDYYNKIAVNLNEKYFSSVSSKWDLAFLPIDSEEGNAYLKAMKVCMQFAHDNRDFMMTTLFEIVHSIVHVDVDVTEKINAHHNYCSLENHFGENVYVHRKGAIRVREGELGIIPGSMGTPSYIVKGLGNPESFMSASHGAGRTMSRTAINKTFSEEEANKSIEGIVFDGWGKDRRGNLDISECPLAYKDIENVIENEKDLVTPIVKLTPLASMKG